MLQMFIFSMDSNHFEALVYEALYDVADPEVGVNIVDLGLVYDMNINKTDGTIDLTLTLTSPACPLQEEIEKQVINALAGLSENGPRFNWVFTPLWSPAFMTDEGREQLSALGGYIPVY